MDAENGGSSADVWGTKAETIEGTDGSWQVRVESTVYSLLEHQEGRSDYVLQPPRAKQFLKRSIPLQRCSEKMCIAVP